MYLLDTDICIAITKADRTVMAAFESRRNDCSIPIIVVSELYKGAYCSQRIESNLGVLNEFLQMVPVVAFDMNAAKDFGRIQAELKMVGRPTGVMDTLIAAIARSRSATLVTHNTKDFENIPELKIEDWLS